MEEIGRLGLALTQQFSEKIYVMIRKKMQRREDDVVENGKDVRREEIESVEDSEVRR